MNNKEVLQRIVRQQIFDGHSRVEIFNSLNWRLNYANEDVASQTVNKWFGKLECNNFLDEKDKIPPGYLLALKIIDAEFKKSAKSLSQRKCPAKKAFNCQITLLSERYALDLCVYYEDSFELYLFDNYFGQNRPLRILNTPTTNLKFDDDSRLAALGEHHFLILNSFHTPDREFACRVQLFELSISELKYKLLDEVTIVGYFFGCLLDETDPNKFLLYTSKDDTVTYRTEYNCLYKMSIKNNNKLDIDGTPLTYNFKPIHSTTLDYVGKQIDMTSLKYENDKLIALETEKLTEELERMCFVELDLGAEQVKRKELREVEMAPVDPGHDNIDEVSAWSGNRLYSMIKVYGRGFRLLQFDIDTGKMTKHGGYSNFDQISEFIVRNETIFLLSTNNQTKQHVLKTLLTPPKLSILAMQRIRQQLMFSDNKNAFNSLLNSLPPKMRLFGR